MKGSMLVAVVGAMGLAACGTTSHHVAGEVCLDSECLQPGLLIEATPGQVSFTAAFWYGLPDVIVEKPFLLDDEDGVSVTFGGQRIELSPSIDDGDYRATIASTTAFQGGESFEFDVARAHSASGSFAGTMPAPIVIASLPASVSRARDVVVNWVPPQADDSQALLSANGHGCIQTDDFSLNFPVTQATYTIGKTYFVDDPTLQCTVEVALGHETIDTTTAGTFLAGSVEAITTVSTSFESTP